MPWLAKELRQQAIEVGVDGAPAQRAEQGRQRAGHQLDDVVAHGRIAARGQLPLGGDGRFLGSAGPRWSEPGRWRSLFPSVFHSMSMDLPYSASIAAPSRTSSAACPSESTARAAFGFRRGLLGGAAPNEHGHHLLVGRLAPRSRGR